MKVLITAATSGISRQLALELPKGWWAKMAQRMVTP
jgi:hypothetical protein